ncbi:MAG TPA: pilin [Pseudomonadales bacterium]|nr:pilin [Pseudomonadales bacterium]
MTPKISTGFTLLEMMIVVAIIAILATLAIPTYLSSVAKDQIVESLALVEQLKLPVDRYWQASGKLPANNLEAGIPAPKKLIGNYVDAIELENGAYHIVFGKKAVKILQGKILTVRAITVVGSLASPMSWLCGYSTVPTGMEAVGENRTSVQPAGLLPVQCRRISN